MPTCPEIKIQDIFSSYDPSKPNAYCKLQGGPLAPCIDGDIYLYQIKEGVYIKAYISGIPVTNPTGIYFHGFHIHQVGNCEVGDSNNPFGETGNHFNPTQKVHPYHAGDLPPILSSNGIGILSVYTRAFNVDDVIGKSFVLHENPDDFSSQPAGDAGRKIACGIIVPYK